MSNLSVVILAAGIGSRMQNDTPKQFLKVGNEQLLDYSIEAFLGVSDEIIVTLPSLDHVPHLKHQDTVTYVVGGATRTESVSKALEHVTRELVLVHDSARPFVTPPVIAEVVDALADYSASCPVMPVVNTIVVDSNDELDSTPTRAAYREVQTPQGFHTDVLREAIDKLGEEHAHLPELVRRRGYRVRHTTGSPWLFKVTYAPSLHMAAYYVDNILNSPDSMTP
jgi:2-C-methyl-D-erythritol 4-phosphate cytidylyltransferase